ncbi:hypothetical protein [Streptomyces sp. DSM 40484]|uniref:hypothetical protein n=1 Tax=Streptomyces kroppenstedtii TaxID=3051181 RepID=UPI0028D45205|nr:hypothetical protein [Streptomyces sp. DSM 40484]
MEVALAGLFALAGTVTGALLQQRADRHRARAADQAAHRQAVRGTVVDLVSALSAHRGHLYRRWELARDDAATGAQTEEVRLAGRASRGAVTAALYRLRALTRDDVLLTAATAAVSAAYAVKPRGEDLTQVTAADTGRRYRRAIDADDAVLTVCARHLNP